MTRRLQLDGLAATDLAQRVALDEAALRALAKTRSPLPCGTAPRSVLVTGASGFLGSHVLQRLLAQTDLKELHVVVRDPGRLAEQCRRYGLPTAGLARLRLHRGDLAGMDPSSLPDVDVVLHGAASVHALHPLTTLWRDNVETTRRLCQRYGGEATTRLLFVSTLSVFVSSNRCGTHQAEVLPATDDYRLIGGYAQSKYLGERLVEAVGGDIVRLGLLTGSRHLGCFPERDFFTLLLRTLHRLGAYPEAFVDAEVDVTPVDWAAEVLVQRVLSPGPGSRRLHVANPRSLGLSEVVAALGLEPLPKTVFLEKLKALPRLTQILLEYAFFKPEALARYPHYFNVDLFQSTGHRYGDVPVGELDPVPLLRHYLRALQLETSRP